MIPPSLQATSAGTINVATWPGAVRAARIASTASLSDTGSRDGGPQPFGIGAADGFDVGF